MKIPKYVGAPRGRRIPVEAWLSRVGKELREKAPIPQPILRVMNPKPNGGSRPLGIPAIKDRVIQTASVTVSVCHRIIMKQTLFGSLAPPKVSTKARFMNIHRLVKWAEQILKHSPRGRASEGSIISKLRESLGKLSEYQQFIRCFFR